MVNRVMCEILGYPRTRLLGKSLVEVTHPDDRAIERAHLAELLSGSTSRYPLDQRSVRGADGRPDYLIRHVDDITDDKAAEAAMVRAKRRLEEAFDNAAIGKALVDLGGRYLQVNAAMCFLVGYDAEELVGRRLQELTHPDDLAADLAQMQRLLDGEIRSYSLMISALLEYSRVGRRDNELTIIDMNEVLAHVLDALHSAVQASGATIVAGHLPTVVGDPFQWEHLLLNLIDNSIKFKSPNRCPEITITSARRDGAWEIAIRDNGIGIKAADTGEIFRVFARLHPVDAYPGAGIGLAICKKIVERRGGQIRVMSAPGRGATFIISIPDAKPNVMISENGDASPPRCYSRDFPSRSRGSS